MWAYTVHIYIQKTINQPNEAFRYFLFFVGEIRQINVTFKMDYLFYPNFMNLQKTKTCDFSLYH